MRNKINTITLPVQDISASLKFYRESLGLRINRESFSKDHAAFACENGLYFVLLQREEFNLFAKMLNQSATTKGQSECILTYFAGTRDEVDEIISKAREAGVNPLTAQDKAWGYAGYFTDIDGHIWEIIHNPNMFSTEEKRTWN